jgi:diaminopimelate decarboxylase
VTCFVYRERQAGGDSRKTEFSGIGKSTAEIRAALAAGIGGGSRRPRPRILLEPGRSLAGNAGVFVTRVEYLKHGTHRNFAIIDAAMNDLMRRARMGCR